ncbi:Ribosomal protein S18 acetylase RimI [Amphibacillus marinus]|uniref:Ribosomal protein S18 acetylase RimI n=1 Tax=Amphibacillus marinus TaxID=872970 RepID=A0A1H8KLY7_9BACI|nr:GNAT family N-acetyltransferase [Amphibacillus marinus]SEN93827.1 Ribosomal protein S18 acetylase RimI [Amphibacillus marinus]
MTIRPYQEKDNDKIIKLADRFSAIPFMTHRNQEDMEQKQLELAKKAISSRSSDIFVAEENDNFLGYIELTEVSDYFTTDSVAYISAIAVTHAGEGKGIGKQLMEKADQWCLAKGCKYLALDVFTANEQAINFYNHLGYQAEIVKMVKSPK